MRLGEFQINGRIGRGGMGEVWRATHMPSGGEFAIKAILADGAWDEKMRTGFEREIRAVAGLSHRGIVKIIDQGEVPEGSQLKNFSAGTPWFAMELATGTLPQSLTTWGQTARVILEVLDALAHAHARGVIHRDLKPDNILLKEDEKGRLRTQLTDFGIAHLVDPGKTLEVSLGKHTAGTPSFMAPEQFHGWWRKYGPWTDLYAFGCLVYQLVCGRPPYEGDSVFELAMLHLQEPFPALEPKFEVPEGFDDWIRKLTQKEIPERFQSAADAVWHFLRLSGADFAPDAFVSLDATRATDAQEWDLATIPLTGFGDHKLAKSLVVDSAGQAAADRFAAWPPMPQRFGSVSPSAPEWLQGVGQNLFGLRAVPFVGREVERQALWDALATVRETGKLHTMVIEGDAGVGKSACVNWTAFRALEVGAVLRYIRSGHSESPSAMQGISRALVKLLPVTGLTPKTAFEFLTERLTEYGAVKLGFDVEQLAAECLHLAGLETPDGVPRVNFEHRNQRYVVGTRLLRMLAHDRPLIVSVDDAQWGEDTVEFIEFLRERAPDLQALIVVSGRPGSWVDTVTADLQLRMTRAPDDEFEAFVRGLFPLNEDTTQFLKERSHQQFATAKQMVADWIAEDALIATPGGFGLKSESMSTREVDSLWARRIRRVLGTTENPETARVALEAAVALGGTISIQEWQSVCANLGVKVPPRLVQALELEGLAVDLVDSWFFNRTQVPSELRRVSLKEMRWKSILVACAQADMQFGQASIPIPERRARYWDEAGYHESARPFYVDAVEDLMAQAVYGHALALMQRIREIDQQTEVPSHAAEAIQVTSMWVEASRFTGNMGVATSEAHQLEADSESCDDSRVAANAFRVCASMRYVVGDDQQGEALYRRARDLFQGVGDRLGVAKILHGQAWFHMNRGQFNEARALYRQAVNLALEAEDELQYAWCLQGMADVDARMHNPEGLEYALLAYEIATKLGSRSCAGMALKTMGDFMQQGGEDQEAESRYGDALRAFEDCDSSLAGLALTRIAVLKARTGDYQAADQIANDAMERYGRRMAMQLRLTPLLVLLLAGLNLGRDVGILRLEIDEVAAKSSFSHPDVDWLAAQIAAAEPGLATWIDTAVAPHNR